MHKFGTLEEAFI